MSAADGDGFVERPAFAWTRSVVSLATESAAALEDGGRDIRGSLSNCRDFESDSWAGDSALVIYSQQRCVQCRDGRAAHMDGHAAGHPRVARLAASARMK